MKHIIDCNVIQQNKTAVTLGNFDGFHRGHQELINITKKCAKDKNLDSIVFTFSPHPMFLFNNKEHSALIMSQNEKAMSIKHFDIDVYIEYPFTKEFAKLSPEEFIEDIIFSKLKCEVLVVGENYKFGHKHSGNTKLLQKLCDEKGIELILVPPVLYEKHRVSSTRIRTCLLEKDIEKANLLMDRPYFVTGEVIHGKKLGRTLGFPTLNILADLNKIYPPNGVYATITSVCGKHYYGVTNVGYNPTVKGKVKLVETYLFNFNESIYGEFVKIYFYRWIRDENKFANLDELKNQLESDITFAHDIFNDKTFDKM